MALIDVSEVLLDPDFTDPIQIITRVPTIDTYGQLSLVESTINTIGCVQPASSKDIERLPEALRVTEMNSFWFRGIIPVTSAGVYPAVMTFRSKRYQILSVSDWMNYGAGYSQGMCVAEVPS